MEKLGITVSLTSDYHPQANGQEESANQEIGRFLWENAPQQFKHMAQVTKEFAGHRRGETLHYEPGDRVWLCTKDICIMEGYRKLLHHHIGPFKILH